MQRHWLGRVSLEVRVRTISVDGIQLTEVVADVPCWMCFGRTVHGSSLVCLLELTISSLHGVTKRVTVVTAEARTIRT
jgi:hypothetical protein